MYGSVYVHMYDLQCGGIEVRQTREGIRSMLGQILATHAEDMKQLTETLKREREDTEQ